MAQQTNDGKNDDVIDIAERIKITYGSRIVIEHVNTQYRLHSHHAYYPAGSKQQQVTCFSNHNSDDWFIVKPNHNNKDSLKLFQTEVKNGDKIRLQHYNTGAYLHSHKTKAHVVKDQHEVTCYWSHDSNNDWKLELKGNGAKCWKRGQKFNLIHCNMNRPLHSHNSLYPDWGNRQQEVTLYTGRDSNDDWFVSKVEKDQFW